MLRKLVAVAAVAVLFTECGPGNTGTGGSAGGGATAGGATAGGRAGGMATAGGATAGGATAGGATAGGATAGGGAAGGSTAGGAAGGATAGGATAGGGAAGGSAGGATAGGGRAGGGTAGGATAGGGAAGGATAGGGSAGGAAGGGMPISCDITAPVCPVGSVCMLTNITVLASTCLPGCDLAAQNCPGGEKCTYALQGMSIVRKCVPTGTVAEGQPCTSNMTNSDDCGGGLICLNQPTGLRCTQFCSLQAPASCANGGYCAQAINANMMEFATVCAPPCSLLSQTCPAGGACVPIATATTCVPAGSGAPGTTCAQLDACVAGSTCNLASATCERLCALDGGTPGCTGMQTCQGAALPQGAGTCQ